VYQFCHSWDDIHCANGGSSEPSFTDRVVLGDPIRSCRVKRNNVQRGATTYESPKLPQFRPGCLLADFRIRDIIVVSLLSAKG
jgi:hypothetical protein